MIKPGVKARPERTGDPQFNFTATSAFSDPRFSAFIRGLFRFGDFARALNQTIDFICRGVAGAPGAHEAFRSQP